MQETEYRIQRYISTVIGDPHSTNTSAVNEVLERLMTSSNFQGINAITPVVYENNIAYVIDCDVEVAVNTDEDTENSDDSEESTD